MSSSLLVFINRKLISIDAILPLLCEVKDKNKLLKIKVVCPDYSTLEGIKKNHFIDDQIKNIGTISVLTLRKHNGKRSIKSIIKALILLGFIFKDVLLKNTSFIHFGLLFTKSFNFLNFFNKNNSYYCESDPYGFTQLMQDVTFLKKNHPINSYRIKNGNVIAFSKVWNIDKNNEYKYFYYGPSRKRKFWINLVLSKSEYYLEKELIKNRLDKNSTLISVMLGYFGELKYLSNKDSVMNCLDDTIKILSKHIKKEVVVFKPHVFTDLVILEKILKKYKNFNYIITYLHPMILATRSKFAIGNYYSTTLSDFNALGVKTIEYTDYCPEALSLTFGGSVRPEKIDYFINKDELHLSDTVKKLFKTVSDIKYNYNNINAETLFSALNGKKL
jgi:hypothetical protein